MPTLHREMTYRFTTRGPLATTHGSPRGERQYFEMTAGTLFGNRINARIGMPGGDWLSHSPDGLWHPDVRVKWVTEDDALILLHWTGLVERVMRRRRACSTLASRATPLPARDKSPPQIGSPSRVRLEQE